MYFFLFYDENFKSSVVLNNWIFSEIDRPLDFNENVSADKVLCVVS